jgi:hypothetical protein
MGFLVFIKPRIFLRTFIPDSNMANIIGAMMMILFIYKVFKYLSFTRLDKHLVYFVAFIAILWIRYIAAGVPISVIVQDIPTLVGLVAVIIFIKDASFIMNVFKVFSIVMVINAFAIYSPWSIITQGFDNNTGYGFSSYLENRATGFTVAPGVLSFYSAVGLVFGITLFSQEKKFIWLLMIMSAFICGVASGNRTFIIGLAISIVLIPVLLETNKARLVYGTILVTGVLFILSPMKYIENYRYNMIERFSENELQKAIDVRYSGSAGILPVIRSGIKNPIFGSINYDSYRQEIYIIDGNYRATTSNGFAAMFATMGLFYVGIFTLGTILAFYRFVSSYRNADSTIEKTWSMAFIVSYMTGHIICIFDGLLLNYMMLIFLAIGIKGGIRFVHSKQQTRRSLYID